MNCRDAGDPEKKRIPEKALNVAAVLSQTVSLFMRLKVGVEYYRKA
jgi:hypothetical protein